MSEQSVSSTSLHGFCKQFDLSKTTVHRYCKENGIPTSNGLSANAVERLKVAFNVLEPAAAPTSELPTRSAIGRRLALATIHPVSSAIVPAIESLPTDTREAQTLAATGKLAIQQNSQDLAQIRDLLQQVNAFVDGKIQQLDQETEATQQQVQELKDLAFQLEVKRDTLRRAEIRNAAAREESESAKTAATNKVVNLSDFFSKKSTPQPGS